MYNFRYNPKTGENKVKVLRATKICCAALTFCYILLCSARPCALPAKAEDFGTYLRVITSDTPFFRSAEEKEPLFFLPYTYYVKIIDYGAEFTRVEYGISGYAIDGYVPTEKLFRDGLEVKNPFPEITVTTAENAVLYADKELSLPLQHVFSERELFYYGEYLSAQGERIYYLGYNNRLGYVKEAALKPFTVPPHPNERTFLHEETPDNGSDDTEYAKTKDTLFNLRVIIIVLLAAAGITALFIAFAKKPKTNAAASYYDENDYE